MTKMEDLQKLIGLIPHEGLDERHRRELFAMIYAILDDYETRIAALEAA